MCARVVAPCGAKDLTHSRAERNSDRKSRMTTDSSSRLVVCVGASIIHGSVSFNFVNLLKERLGPRGFRFVNAGVNGDLAYNVLERLNPIIDMKPDFAVILVGSNDVMSTLSESAERNYTRMKHLPQKPTLDWYRENLEAVVNGLQQRTKARVALSSLPVLGEDLSSEPNLRTARYNEVIKDIAKSHHATFLPVNEAMTQYLRSVQKAPGRAFEGQGLMWKAILRHSLLRQSFDKISEKNGFLLTIEGIHMNSRAGTMIADQVEAFLQSPPPS